MNVLHHHPDRRAATVPTPNRADTADKHNGENKRAALAIPKTRLTLDQARLRPHLRTGRQPDSPVFQPTDMLDQQLELEAAKRSRLAVPTAGELRGIPVQARGSAGTSPGTNPLAELLRSQP